MEIKTLEIDFEKESLKINGLDFTKNPVIVTLLGTDGWPLQKLFNKDKASGRREKCDKLDIAYVRSVNSMTANQMK